MPDPVLSLAGVTLRYEKTTAVADVSFDVRRGEMFGLIGPDGAGKTTTIRLLCGLLRPQRGQVRILGLDPVGQHRAVTRSIGYLSQRFSLYGDLSIDENIAFFAEIHGVSNFGPARDRLLDMTHLTPFRSRLAERLSGGMKQKLALACTLVHQPQVILLDEPTTGVDPVSRREFWKLLSEFLAEGITIFMATPYLDEAERCSRVALLHEGRLIALDSPGELRQTLPGDVIEVIAQPTWGAVDLLAGLAGLRDVQTFGERIHVRFEGAAGHDAVARVTAALGTPGISVESVRPVHPSLEDVFIHRITAAQPADRRSRGAAESREHS